MKAGAELYVSGGYITSVEDFAQKASDYFGSRGACGILNRSESESEVKLVLYGSLAFYMGEWDPRRGGLSFQYEIPGMMRSTEFFNESLSITKNDRAAVEHAFAVIENFARLRLPDKYLAMCDAP